MCRNSGMNSRSTFLRRERLAVMSRIIAAIPANYLLTSIITGLIARLLPLGPAAASITATLTSFALFAGIAMAVFHARFSGRLWSWMIGAILVVCTGQSLSFTVGGRLWWAASDTPCHGS